MHDKILNIEDVALVVVDVQEAFRSAIPESSAVIRKIATLAAGCRILEIPTIVTEQYPKGLGHTVEEIAAAVSPDAEIIEKSTFSSCGAADFLAAIARTGSRQIILCGVETHICVNQTAHDLLDSGLQVHLLTDAVGSRFDNDRQTGIQKIVASGAIASTVEMALFELLRDSKNPKFKEIQALVK